MAKDKERSVNPAQAQRRLEKQKALKKGKAEVQARRNEKLARRNPDRLQRQVDELKAVEEAGQPLRPRDKQHLEELERDLRAVKKAREALGDKAPTFGGDERRDRGGDGQHHGVLGKRRRDGQAQWRQRDDSSDTDESVRNIPMPRDTPPPIPRRRPTNANREPLGAGRGERQQQPPQQQPHELPPKPIVVPEVKTVYEAAPAIRNLRQEAVSRFVPAVVRRKQDAVKGQGGLLEPEEMDRLEEEGYLGTAGNKDEASMPESGAKQPTPSKEDIEARLAEEEERFNRELKTVQIEEVEDEDL
ncbi:hypothetical protein AJ80_09661 [Polytolypa hystricis UAMH7299]|uniref:Wbp11/ELF5/Saf1 N-terminal domain-containing protein n=1 Tax=Polytolypa hystricis (strain UAMH7299) TaxID=1447883 RepID=A0A2B7WLV1_POLH7|nr:hypothetical protein AJ80_09661 [Polytolypa hystricis UAMH7299]